MSQPALKLVPAPPADDRPRPLRFPDGLGLLLERYDAACRREAEAPDPVARAAAEAEKAALCDEYRWGARDLAAVFCLMLRHARQWNPTAVNDLVAEAVREVLREEIAPLVNAVARLEARR